MKKQQKMKTQRHNISIKIVRQLSLKSDIFKINNIKIIIPKVDITINLMYNIIKLTNDSLVISDEDDTYEYTHPVYEEDLEDGVNYDPGDESDYKI